MSAMDEAREIVARGFDEAALQTLPDDTLRERLRRTTYDPETMRAANLKLAAAWYAWTLAQPEREQRQISAMAASMMGIPSASGVLAGILDRWNAAIERIKALRR